MKTLLPRPIASALVFLCLALSCQAAAPRPAGVHLATGRQPSPPTPTLLFAATPLTADEQTALAQRSALTLEQRTDKAGASDRTKVVWIVVGVAVLVLAAGAITASESVNNMHITVNP